MKFSERIRNRAPLFFSTVSGYSITGTSATPTLAGKSYAPTDPVFTILGTNPVWADPYISFANVTLQRGRQGFSSGGAIEFRSDAASFELILLGNNAWIRLLVDDKEAIAKTYIPNTGAATHIRISGPASNASRRYRIENGGTLQFGGVITDSALTSVSQATTDRLRIAFVGDSYGNGIEGRGWPQAAAESLGIYDCWSTSSNGTGWITGNGNLSFQERYMQDVVAAAPDAVVIWLGINDAGAPADQIHAAVADVVAGLIERLAVPVFVIGPQKPYGYSLEAEYAAIRAASRSSGAHFIDNRLWQDNQPGTVAAPQGLGNGDLYLAADGLHPNAAGYGYLGKLVAESVKSAALR